MSLLKISLAVVLACGVAAAQESLMEATHLVSLPSALTTTGANLAAPQPTGTGNQPMGMGKMKLLIKQQVNKVIDGSYPSVTEWQPLTKREKFNVFLHSTYSPWTFVNAAIDQATDHVKGRRLSQEYETGFRGQAQSYGIALATTETDVFFQRFLFPTLFKQDPRYFRNPDLPFLKRVLYSMSRVVITRTDSGGQAFNASRILGNAASQAVADLYVPGQRQGMHPIAGTISYNLLRDMGMNLVHEFWPDVRRKVFHRK
jgi:hypothetical protein